MAALTTKAIRMHNARVLAARAGGAKGFGDKLGKSASQVSQIIGANKAGDASLRGIGSKLAREIEAAFGEGEGWLDVPHLEKAGESKFSPPEEQAMDVQRSVAELVKAWLSLNERDRNRFKREIVTLALQNMDDVRDEKLGHLAAPGTKTSAKSKAGTQ